MEQDSARGASAFLLTPPINAQRAMSPEPVEWHVELCLRVFFSSSCVLCGKVYRYGTFYLGGRARFVA